MDAASPTRPLVQLGRWSVATALAALLALGVLLTARRFVGVQRPLDPASVVVLAILLAAAAGILRMLWLRMGPRGPAGSIWLAAWLAPTIFVLLMALAMFTSGTSAAALLIAWLLIIAEEGFMLWRTRSTGRLASPTRQRGTPSLANQVPAPRPSLARRASAEGTMQSIVRTVEDDGTHTVAGTLRALFRPGERTAAVHVGFCPPLPALPQLECEQTGGPEAGIKLAQLLPQGARLDVRLQRRPDQAAIVEIEFHAAAREPPRRRGGQDRGE